MKYRKIEIFYKLLAVVTLFFFVSAVYALLEAEFFEDDLESEVILGFVKLNPKYPGQVHIRAINQRRKKINIKVNYEYFGESQDPKKVMSGTGEVVFRLAKQGSKKKDYQVAFNAVGFENVTYRIVSIQPCFLSFTCGESSAITKIVTY